MADEANKFGHLLSQIPAIGKDAQLPPVHKWNPGFCGDIDMVIKADGSWHYMGTPIARQSMVRLFSTVLKKEGGKYFLVTPVEKVGIQVEVSPFITVAMAVSQEGLQQVVQFATNVGDQVTLNSEHPLRVETDPVTGEPSPYILVRDELEARINRNVFYELVNLATVQEWQGGEWYGVESCGRFFPLALSEK